MTDKKIRISNLKWLIFIIFLVILLLHIDAHIYTYSIFDNNCMSMENPFFAISMDYYAYGWTHIESLYDNTTIKIDRDNDGVWDEYFVLNKGIRKERGLPPSAHIQSTKPILVWTKEHAGYNYHYDIGTTFIPPASELGKDYFIPCLSPTDSYIKSFNVFVIVVPIYSNTNIQIDKDNDGWFEKSINLGPGQTYFETMNNGGKIHSDKPVMAIMDVSVVREKDDHTIGYGVSRSCLARPGNCYYTTYGKLILYAIGDTTIYIDTNRDGVTDSSFTMSASSTKTLSNYPYATKIYSPNKFVLMRYDEYTKVLGDIAIGITSLAPSKELGMDYFLRENAYVYAIFSNTTIYLDYDNDGVFEEQQIIGTSPTLITAKHIHANKPIAAYIVKRFYDGNNYYCYLDRCPVASISVSTDIIPNEMGYNETAVQHIVVANPTEVIAKNFTIIAYTPKQFFVENPLAIKIVKKDLYSDALISSEEIQVVPSITSDNHKIEISYIRSNLLKELSPHEYYLITFNIKSPLHGKTYIFKPVEVTYMANTWVNV